MTMRIPSNNLLLDANAVFVHNAHQAALQATQLDATLRSIDEITNMDVEMQIPLAEQLTIIVLDTNILLEFLDIIQLFVSEVGQQQLPVLIIIPGVVIHELDSQKNRNGLSWFARRASTWLLKKVKERKSVKGQALDETCKPSGNWKTREPGEVYGTERANDGLILDCCQYFSRIRQRRTFLCTKDKLLAVEAESVGLPTLFPDRAFCSRDIAQAAFGSEVSIRFSGPSEVNQQNTTDTSLQEDDDGMDVDDYSVMTHVFHPSHPLDRLHLAVIDHFGQLLLDLATRVAGPDAQKFGTEMLSSHAPSYARKKLKSWEPTESVEFLNTKKACPRSSPRVDVFLKKPGVRSARKGQDWSRRDWEVALSALGSIGDLWDEVAIQESVLAVKFHTQCVFEMEMRPTGVGVWQ